MLLFETIISGRVKNIVAIKDGVRCASIEYIKSLEKKIRIKIFAVMNIMADFGVIRNKEKFNHLEGKIYEFKAQKAQGLLFPLSERYCLYSWCKQAAPTPTKNRN